jgi:hypothetical protein
MLSSLESARAGLKGRGFKPRRKSEKLGFVRATVEERPFRAA